MMIEFSKMLYKMDFIYIVLVIRGYCVYHGIFSEAFRTFLQYKNKNENKNKENKKFINISLPMMIIHFILFTTQFLLRCYSLSIFF